MRSAPSARAWSRQSASTIRPSASVLSTWIVVPSIARTMSPGLIAVLDGRFSVAPMTVTTCTGRPSRAIAPVASSAAAPPDMSNFMSAMPPAGLIEMPPESNVTAFPTIPSSGPRAVSGS